MDSTKDIRAFNAMKTYEEKNNTSDITKSSQKEIHIKCKYCVNIHEQQRCPRCGKVNHSEKNEETRADRPPEMTKDKQLFMKHIKIMKTWM